jgi:hypothetical protein
VCADSIAFPLVYLSDHDRSKPDRSTVCRRYSELENAAKTGYYLWKAMKWLTAPGRLDPPLP